MNAHRTAIISAAARNNVPAVYALSEYVRDGGLLSYDVDRVDIIRRAATYVDRILRGEKSGDLPVQFPTRFEMVLGSIAGASQRNTRSPAGAPRSDRRPNPQDAPS